MRERLSSLVPFVRRWGWICAGIALALALTGALALAAGSARPSSAAGSGTPSTVAHTAPSATTAPRGSAPTPAIPTPARTTSPTANPNGSLALTCTAHRSAGEDGGEGDDDSVKLALACTVTGAPRSDTSFSLSFGVLDPLGQVHAFTQACTGLLHDGKGSCSQSYTFIFPFPAPPAPVTGQSLPSRHPLGPATPTAI